MKFKRYRIQADSFRGYEVVVWRFWFPFWVQLGAINTHRTIEEAKEYAERFKTKIYI